MRGAMVGLGLLLGARRLGLRLNSILRVSFFCAVASCTCLRFHPEALAAEGRIHLVPQLGHGNQFVMAVDCTQDGQKILTGGSDDAVHVWDARSGSELVVLTGHTGWVTSICVSRTGRLALSCGNHTAILWNLTTKKPVRRFEHAGGILSGAISPNETLVMTAGWDHQVRVWNLRTGRLIHVLRGHTDVVPSAHFSPDGKSAVTASHDHTVRTWDIEDGTCSRILLGHTSYVNWAVFSPDGRSVLSSGEDKISLIHDARTGTVMARLAGHTAAVMTVAYAPDGLSVWTCSKDATIRRWSLQGEELCCLKGHKGIVHAICPTPDGKALISCGYDSSARIWNVATGKEILQLRGGATSVRAVAFSPDGNTILTAGEDGFGRLWDLQGGKLLRTLEGHTSWITAACISRDGKYCATSGFDGTARLWNVASGSLVQTFRGHKGNVCSVDISPDGSTLLTSGVDASVRLWAIGTGRNFLSLMGQSGFCSTAKFSPGGDKIATASRDGSTYIWDARTGRQRLRLYGHKGPVQCAQFDDTGGYLLTTSDDRTAIVWNIADGHPTVTLRGHTDFVLWGAWAGKDVVTASADGSIIVWNPRRGTVRHRLRGNLGWVYSVASTRGSLLASGGLDGTVRFWDAQKGREMGVVCGFKDRSWVILDREGRFDSSGGALAGNIHWVYEDAARNLLEPIDLEQFASAYYTPGFLARVMRREALSPVRDLKNPPLFPSVHDVKVLPLTPQPPLPAVQRGEGGTVAFSLVARGGGIGTAQVLVDGQEVAKIQGKEGKNEVSVPVEIKLDARVDVIAFNQDNSLSSPRSVNTNAPPELDITTPTRYVAVISGINDYQGTLPKLSFAVNDAKDIALSVLACAQGLKITPEIFLLTNDPGAKELEKHGVHVLPATKKSLQGLMTKIIPAGGKWRDSDELFLYFAGHGTSYTEGNQKHYAYLDQDATSADMRLPEVRAQQAVTDDDLVHWLANFIGGKKAMVIDTCAAGAAADVLAQGTRSEDPDIDRKQAVYETQRRTGIQVLFGCPSDLVSYESPEYGHGLLTWSLLNSLANDSLGTTENKGMVMVRTLFDKASHATLKESGGQRALVFGRGENFPIGYLDAAGKKAIPFSSKVPLFGMISLNNRDKDLDDLDLAKQIADALAATARSPEKPPARFAPDSPSAIKVQGGYTLVGDKVSLRMNLIRAGQPPISLTVESTKSTVTADAVKKLLDWARSERK